MQIKWLLGLVLIGCCVSSPAQVPCPPTGDGPCYDAARCAYLNCITKTPTYQCYLKYCADLAACDGGGGDGKGIDIPYDPNN